MRSDTSRLFKCPAESVFDSRLRDKLFMFNLSMWRNMLKSPWDREMVHLQFYIGLCMWC